MSQSKPVCWPVTAGARPQQTAARRRRARAGQLRRSLRAAACGCWRLRSAAAARSGWGRLRAAVMLGRRRHGARTLRAVHCQMVRRRSLSAVPSTGSMLRTPNAHRRRRPQIGTALRSLTAHKMTVTCHAVSKRHGSAPSSSGCPGGASCTSQRAQPSGAAQPCVCGY